MVSALQIENISYLPNFPIIVTAYTKDSHLGDYYQRAAVRLTKSCIKFNLKHIVYPLENAGNWIKGCNLKPTIILNALLTFNKPILWIDADAEIFKHPQIFDQPDFDMALVSGEGNHWLSGTLYCNPKMINFIKKWKEYTESKTDSGIGDEITLRDLYYNSDNSDRPKTKLLPQSYNTVVHSTTDISTITIGHYIREDIAPLRKVVAVPIPSKL